jgi:hypothetical protein
MAVKERGDAGYLEKDEHRISFKQWCINDDGSLTLLSGDKTGFLTDKKRQDNSQNPLFIASNNPWHLTQGTKIVLLLPRAIELSLHKGKETTVSENTKCEVSSEDNKTTSIHFGDIHAWIFKPHNPLMI